MDELAQKCATFDARWQNPHVRYAHRLVTIVCGLLYTGEFVGRIILVYRVSAAVVLVVSPVVTGIGTVLAVLWTFCVRLPRSRAARRTTH